MYLMVTLVFIVLLGFVTADEGGKVFTNDWSVHIAGGVEHAKVVANDTGCVYGHEIIPGEDYYLLHCHKVSRRNADPDEDIQQQIVLNRTKRAPLTASIGKMNLNDPEWGNTR